MVCIPELMAFKMSKGNVAHRYKKKPSLPFVSFHLKLFFVHSDGCRPYCSLSLSLFLSLQKQQAAVMQIQVDAYYIC